MRAGERRFYNVLFMSLPIASRDRLTLQRDADAIGRDISVASSEPET
ncbi:hypothetical protein [Salinisphaera hydrothermalis]